MFRKIRRYIDNPYYALGYDMIKKCPHLMPDKFYISVLWKMVMGYELDWEHPKTYNEKLQWLKLHDRNPLYTTMVDKYRAKQWVADKIGKQYVIPTLAVYNSVDEINLDELPDQFVLKCNHDSGSVVICKDKASFDLDAAKCKLGAAMKKNFYWEAREWPYKNVKRCVFAEAYLDGFNKEGLPDYKFFTFNGEPKFLYITSGRESADGLKEDFFDLEGNHLPFNQEGFVNASQTPSLPSNFEKMIEFSRTLAKGTTHLRVDFFEINQDLYQGELTFFDGGGFSPFYPNEWNRITGDWVVLPTDK